MSVLSLHFRLPLFWPVLCLSFSVYALDYPSFGLFYVRPSRFTLYITPLLACVMSVLLGLGFRLPLFWPVLCPSFSVYTLGYPSFGLCYVCPSRLHFRLPLCWPVLCLSFSVYALDYPSFGLCYVRPSRFTP